MTTRLTPVLGPDAVSSIQDDLQAIEERLAQVRVSLTYLVQAGVRPATANVVADLESIAGTLDEITANIPDHPDQAKALTKVYGGTTYTVQPPTCDCGKGEYCPQYGRAFHR